MRIGIISDTHDRLPAIERARLFFQERDVDAILHPGDIVAPFAAKILSTWPIPLYVTYGNNDGERKGLKQVLPQIQDGPLRLELGAKRILLHHSIDGCNPKDVTWADAIVTGHTHEVTNELRDGKLFLNPGECCGWVTSRCTVAILDTESLAAQIIEVNP